MTTTYLTGIFHWRDHAGELDSSHSSGSIKTLLWGAERWLEANADQLDTLAGNRLKQIKAELEDWLARHDSRIGG